MSFVIHGVRAIFTEQPVQTRHPFSGETVLSRMPVAMSEREQLAVSQLLAEVGVSFGNPCRVEFQDGGLLKIDLDGVGFVISTRCPFSPLAVAFLFQLAQQGNFFCQASMPDGLLLFSQEQLGSIPSEILAELEETPQLCQTVDELARHLGVGHKHWESHRRHVVEGS
jgi:hypothetical protein